PWRSSDPRICEIRDGTLKRWRRGGKVLAVSAVSVSFRSRMPRAGAACGPYLAKAGERPLDGADDPEQLPDPQELREDPEDHRHPQPHRHPEALVRAVLARGRSP